MNVSIQPFKDNHVRESRDEQQLKSLRLNPHLSNRLNWVKVVFIQTKTVKNRCLGVWTPCKRETKTIKDLQISFIYPFGRHNTLC